MTAPDRMFIYGRSCSAKRSDLPAGSNPIEYIRKGAFPVEAIKREIARQKGLTYQGSREVFERILSLLEGSE